MLDDRNNSPAPPPLYKPTVRPLDDNYLHASEIHVSEWRSTHREVFPIQSRLPRSDLPFLTSGPSLKLEMDDPLISPLVAVAAVDVRDLNA